MKVKILIVALMAVFASASSQPMSGDSALDLSLIGMNRFEVLEFTKGHVISVRDSSSTIVAVDTINKVVRVFHFSPSLYVYATKISVKVLSKKDKPEIFYSVTSPPAYYSDKLKTWVRPVNSKLLYIGMSVKSYKVGKSKSYIATITIKAFDAPHSYRNCYPSRSLYRGR